jgi:ATP-dependent 26S proteasome regulatory subunit
MSEIFRIINGALRLDGDRVRNYTAFLAEKLEEAGDTATAARLRKLLQEHDHQLRPAGASAARALPVDSESRFPLIERVNPRAVDEPAIILDESQWSVVREFISVAKSRGQIESQGVTSALSMLMYGPPGTGKSRLARHIAAELGLELYVARLDGLISSFLGSTSKNIRALFEFASKAPCVLFLDEFDAIAKLRGDTQELGELKRVVNSFIQNLDSLGEQSIILAATNHEELLDNAVWRRFVYRVRLSHPGAELRSVMWSTFLIGTLSGKKDLLVLVDLSEGFSGADIREVCLRMQRKQITEKTTSTLHDAFGALRNIAIGEGEDRRAQLSALKGMSPPEIASALRKRNARLYSGEVLGRLLGVSKATAHRWVKSSGADQHG